MTDQPILYRPSQAARLIGVSRMTIYRWIESGRIMPVFVRRQPRIPCDQVDNLRLGIQ